MKITDAIKTVMERKGVTQAALCSRLGVKQQTMSMRMTQDNMSIGKANEMLRAMDYKVVILPREARIPEGGYEVE
jgi:transcriptional regulator with XRE-family HTH domain